MKGISAKIKAILVILGIVAAGLFIIWGLIALKEIIINASVQYKTFFFVTHQ